MKKILITSLATVSVAGMIGGGTFANWSDFATYDNEVGAEFLTLDLTSAGGSNAGIGFVQEAMAPGVNREFDHIVASRQGQVVPTATLTLAVEDFLGEEDGCRGNSEEQAVVDGGDGGNCTTPGIGPDEGEFIDEAYIAINTSAPTSSATPCSEPVGNVFQGTLAELRDEPAIDLLKGDVLEPGESICVRMGIQLPSDENSLPEATNASQGDSASWTFRYDLVQASTGPGVF